MTRRRLIIAILMLFVLAAAIALALPLLKTEERDYYKGATSVFCADSVSGRVEVSA